MSFLRWSETFDCTTTDNRTLTTVPLGLADSLSGLPYRSRTGPLFYTVRLYWPALVCSEVRRLENCLGLAYRHTSKEVHVQYNPPIDGRPVSQTNSQLDRASPKSIAIRLHDSSTSHLLQKRVLQVLQGSQEEGLPVHADPSPTLPCPERRP
jgi:hypothetical protein